MAWHEYIFKNSTQLKKKKKKSHVAVFNSIVESSQSHSKNHFSVNLSQGFGQSSIEGKLLVL